jgi:glucose/arabinose dehydrogenase
LGSELESNKINNLGWPTASYDLHYDRRFNEEAPLHKSHYEHSFVELLVNFTKSIAISQLVSVPNNFAPSFNNDYFAGSMVLNPTVSILLIHHCRLNQANNTIIHQATIKLGDRIGGIRF